jgi:hypothetical protein
MQKRIVILLFMIVWIIITCSALLFGFTYNWPDFVHVDYGLPLTWATNTQSTIAGPVDQWAVNTSNLLIDLIFWLGIMTTVITVLLYKLKP